MTRPAAANGTIGVLVKIFPKLSETFILGEILGLERAGLDLHVFSLRRPTDEFFHAAGEAVRAPLTYMPSSGDGRTGDVLKAHCALLVRHPCRYLSALSFLLRRRDGAGIGEFLQAGCLAQALRGAGIRHLHVHFADAPAGVAEIVERLTGITYSISAHAKDIYVSSARSLRRKVQGARFTVTCTEYNRHYLESVVGPDARVFRMYHGVDPDIFRPEPSARHGVAGDDRPLVLSVGRLREKKGFAVLVEACRLLRDAGIDLRCEIVGYGPERASLERLIDRCGLSDRVALVGKLGREALIARYRRASLFVLPCQVAKNGDRDGIPNVLLEAMAMQLPIISTRVSGIPEVIGHWNNGVLVAPKDPEALTEAIRTLLERPDARVRLGAAARRTVIERFSVDRNLVQVRDLLLDAQQSVARTSENAKERSLVYAR
ncbi:MAG: glycosyltransferase [Alphaproteobacteria bacterium]